MFLPVLLSLGILAAPPVNDRCPVTGFDVSNRHLHHWVTVRGQRFAVHDHRAAELLKRWPEGYLRADGVPFNASVPTPRHP